MVKDLGVGILGAGRVSRDHAYASMYRNFKGAFGHRKTL